jgi:hypothetical protein
MSATNSWHEASAKNPCPICGGKQWCRYSEDMTIACCRKQESHPTWGRGRQKSDKNGDTYFVYQLKPKSTDEQWDAPRYSLADGGGRLADADTLHRVYTALLDALSLTSDHIKALWARGYDEKPSALLKRGYRTLKGRRRRIAYRLVRAGFEADLPRVPGFHVVEEASGSRCWTVGGPSGLLFPVRDAAGRIIALSVRRDEQGDGGKYGWLSSRSKGGASPGSPIHVPEFEGDRTTVRVTEGALKANVATRLSGVLTIGLPGVSARRRAAKVLKEIGAKTARVAFDADACHNRNVARSLFTLVHHLRKRGFTVELEAWDEEDGKGIDDLLAAKKQPDVLKGDEVIAAVASIKAQAEAADPAPAGDGENEGGAKNGRPDIVVCMDEHATNDEAVFALAQDVSLYQRAGQLVRVVRDDSPAARGIRRPYGARIEALPEATLRERLTAAGRWVKIVISKGKEKKVRVHPPKWAISAVHNRADWPNVRHLEAVIEYPALRPDGTLLLATGYDPATGLLLEPKGELPAVLTSPTKDQAIAARDALFEVACDFPFQKPAHKASWLASVLTPLARFAFIGPAPLFLVEANCRGAGKGLLLNLLSQIVKGDNFTIATYTQDEDELRKRITALALAGDRLVLFDNLDGKFGNATLDAALTTTSWKDRLLGVNRVVEAPLYMTWYATGNNVAVGADTSRRICPIRLETDMERPEERKGFRFPNLIEHVNENRGRLLGAALTILRAYCVAGRPDQGLPAWGSFEGWSALVRGAVVWVGLPDPAEARVQLQEQSDTTAENMGVLLECWEKLDPDRSGLTTAEVVGTIYEKGAHAPPDWHAEMRAAIDGLVDRGDARRLGNRLRLFRRRIFSGRYIDHAGSAQRAIRWAVYPASTFRADNASYCGPRESVSLSESVVPNAHASAVPPDDSEVL